MMIKREFRLPLHASLPPQVNDKDRVNGNMEEKNATLRETTEDPTTRIRQEQRKLKERVDRKQNAKEYSLKEGDLVRVQRPVRKAKWHPRLSELLEVVENRRQDTYCLSDGTRWHADRLVSVPATTTADGVERKMSCQERIELQEARVVRRQRGENSFLQDHQDYEGPQHGTHARSTQLILK